MGAPSIVSDRFVPLNSSSCGAHYQVSLFSPVVPMVGQFVVSGASPDYPSAIEKSWMMIPQAVVLRFQCGRG